MITIQKRTFGINFQYVEEIDTVTLSQNIGGKTIEITMSLEEAGVLKDWIDVAQNEQLDSLEGL